MPILMHPDTAVGELKAGAHKFPLQAVDVKGKVQGLLYSATVSQTFRNDRAQRMEAVYVFPLPPKAAVHGFTLTIGERVIEGEIKERGQARRDYQQAVQAGHRAALMEEERSDIFTTTVGNIGPDEEVKICFHLSGPLSCFQNVGRLRFPLVVGEVYVPGRALDGHSVGDGVELDTDQVPDASRITPPRLAADSPNPVKLTLSFEVEPAGLTISKVESTCHFARSKKFEDGRHRVGLLPGVERLDRAFVLEVTYPEDTLQTTLVVDQEKRAFALTVVPPRSQNRATYPRDVVICLDRSGSMGGWSMVAARRAAARIVESLSEQDTFGVVAFDTRTDHFDYSSGLKPANNFYKMRAAEFLGGIEARGGTELLPAMRECLEYFRKSDNRDPHLIIITDGEVANDSTLIRACQQGVRISTIGIGVAARGGLLNRMADTSGGLCTLIPNEADLEKDLAEMHRRWGQPVWKALSLRGADDQFRSPKFWDVWQDVPTTFFGRLKPEMSLDLTEVNGWLDGRGQHAVELKPILTDEPLVYRAWARSRLLDLDDLFTVGNAAHADLVNLSVKAQVLCRFTAFTAIDKSEKVDTEMKLEKAVQPVEATTEKLKAKVMGFKGGMRGRGKPSLKRRSQSVGFGANMGKPTLGGSGLFGGPGAPPAPRGHVLGVAPPSPPAPPACSMPAPACEPAPMMDMADDAFMMECSMPPMEEACAEAPPADLFSDDDAAGGGLFEQKKESAPTRARALRAQPPQERVESARVEVAMQRLQTLLQGDGFLALASGNSQSFGAQLKECLTQVAMMVKLLSDYLREGVYPESWSIQLRELLSRVMDYQEALEDLQSVGGEDLSRVKQSREALESELVALV